MGACPSMNPSPVNSGERVFHNAVNPPGSADVLQCPHDEDARGMVHDPDLISPTTASSPPAVRPSLPPLPRQQNTDDLTTRLTTVADELENAFAVSRSLQVQQCGAQAIIQLLEAMVVALEDLVHRAKAAPVNLPFNITHYSQPSSLKTTLESPAMGSRLRGMGGSRAQGGARTWRRQGAQIHTRHRIGEWRRIVCGLGDATQSAELERRLYKAVEKEELK